MEMFTFYPKELPQYVDLWKRAERRNDARAQFLLAEHYAAIKSPEAVAKAVELYRKSAHKGCEFAQFALGKCYEFGYGVRVDRPQAIKWYGRAAEMRMDLVEPQSPSVTAMRAKVRDFLKGLDQVMEVDENSPLGQEATDEDSIRAEEQAAAFIEQMEREQEAYSNLEWVKQAAEQGDCRAQLRLAQWYDKGDGVEQDDERAVFWFLESANHGNEDAVKALAEHYTKCRRYKDAVQWHRRYAEIHLKRRVEEIRWRWDKYWGI
ncbi:MAG: tetratricopeptide repeat protein [Clostridia bacterium]